MNSKLTLRIRHPGGTCVISDIDESQTISQLKQYISKQINISPECIQIKYGYPPQIASEDSNTLLNLNISDGDSLLIEQLEPEQNQKIIEEQQENQQPNKDGMIMIKRAIPANNSCLFQSISYALEKNSQEKAKSMRQIVAKYIQNNQELYNELYLEKSNKEYVNWIQKESSWGGAIELDILSREYKTEICAVNIQTTDYLVFGSESNFKKRIYLLYDGIHYDIVVRNIFEEMEPNTDITVFDPNDQYALNGVLFLAKILRKKREFTDLGNFTLKCNDCFKGLKGQQEAVQHNKETGHFNFVEMNSR